MLTLHLGYINVILLLLFLISMTQHFCWLNMYLELILLIPHITREGMSVPEQGLAYCWLVCPGYWSNNTGTPVMSTKNNLYIHIFIDDSMGIYSSI